MSINIKHAEVERLVRMMVMKTRESITDAVRHSLEERLLHLEGRRRTIHLREELLAIGKRCAALPDQDVRSSDEILGYDEYGLPS